MFARDQLPPCNVHSSAPLPGLESKLHELLSLQKKLLKVRLYPESFGGFVKSSTLLKIENKRAALLVCVSLFVVYGRGFFLVMLGFDFEAGNKPFEN